MVTAAPISLHMIQTVRDNLKCDLNIYLLYLLNSVFKQNVE